jgi:hypothetical protein
MGATNKPPTSRSGLELDDEGIDELVDQVEDDDTEWSEPLPKEQRPARGPGRPSLGGVGEHSPRVSFRVDADTRTRAAERAAREGKTVSALAREALEQYLAS